MRILKILVLFTFCLQVLINSDSLLYSDGFEPMTNLWNAGDSWSISVELYSRDWAIAFSDPTVEAEKGTPRVLARYTMQVTITGTELVDDSPCWQVDFTPSTDAPSGVREQRYRVLVNKEKGSPVKIIRLAGEEIGNPSIVKLGETTMIRNAPYGFPLDILPTLPDRQGVKIATDRRLSLNLKKRIVGNEQVVEAKLKKRGKEVTIRQRWTLGAKWWTEYEKYNNGNKELYARITHAE